MLYHNERIEKSLIEMGFVEFTAIQSKTIPLLEEGRDVIGHSQTGTGKTAAFTLPILNQLDFNSQDVQALIICPTRELVVQVKREIDKIGKYIPQLKTVSVYGGEPITKQIGFLKKKPQIIVGTPGRTIDHINRKLIRLGNLKYMVLDEADEMMKMGFKEDIETILDATNPARQTIMFSATMPKQIIHISKQYMNNPEVVSVVTDEETNKDITQYYYNVKQQNKVEAIARLLHVYNSKLTLIFCNTKRKVDEVTRDLIKKGYNVDKIHGDLPQTQRLDILNKFHNGVLDIMVATDVAARGLDIKNVETVINHDVPEKAEFYVHRIGRTGRIGNKGFSFTLVSRREASRIDDIERFTKTKIKKRSIPTPEKVIRVKQEKQIEEIQNIIDTENTFRFDETSYALLLENKEHIVVSALLSMLEKKDHSEQVTGDINEDFRRKGKSIKDINNTIRFHINMGTKTGASPKKLADFVSMKTNLRNKEISDITVRNSFSFFTVKVKNKDLVERKLRNVRFNGKKVSVQIAGEKSSSKKRYN